MKPLVTDQRILTWLCVLPAKPNTSKWEKMAYIASVLVLIVVDLTVFTSSVMYAIKFMLIDILETSYGFFQAVATVVVANAIVVVFFRRHTIPPVIEKLSKFYEKYKDEDSFHYVAHANNTSERFWAIYFKFTIGGAFIASEVFSIGSVFMCWLLHGHFDATQVFRPLRFILPWDQSTLLGYFGEISYTIFVCEVYFLHNAAVLLPFISICLHHQAFYKMFRHSVDKLNHSNESRNDKEFFCELIEFHNWIKSWFAETADLYSPHFMVQLICHMLILSAHVFELNQQGFGSIFGFLFLGGANALLSLFLFCFLGKLASESYARIGDSLYDDCNWLELPIDLQKYVILMIANAQIPLNYHGYGMIILNLEAFCKFMQAVFRYVMIFRTLSVKVQ